MITTTTDDFGRTIYVNEPVTMPRRGSSPAASRSSLVYWSVTEHKWKPVPSANVRAARSAAAEVNRYFEPPSAGAARSFTSQDIEAAIQQAAARHNVDPSLASNFFLGQGIWTPSCCDRSHESNLQNP